MSLRHMCRLNTYMPRIGGVRQTFRPLVYLNTSYGDSHFFAVYIAGDLKQTRSPGLGC